MNIAFIKDTKCFNIAEFDSAIVVQEFKANLQRDGIVDTMIVLPEGYGIGDKYENGVWTKTIIIPDLDGLRNEKIAQSKQQLAEFLENHPLLHSGEYYSVTQEKQALLTSAIAAYQLKAQAGIPAILKWNTTGDICREFTIEEITGLVIAITDYVQPRVEKQQELEVQIKNCITIEELDSIVIDYEVI